MSDDEAAVEEKSFAIEVAKQGRAVCKKCKEKCLQGELRLAKLVFNPFGDGKMKSWHHIDCLFELFLKQRQTTKRIEDPDDIDGWNSISNDDKQYILEKIRECDQAFHAKYGDKANKLSKKQINKASSPKSKQKETKTDKIDPPITEKSISEGSSSSGKESKDNSFKEFRRLVADVTNISSYLDKTECVRKVFTHGSDGTGFKGDIVLWCRLLLPGVIKRVYNLQSKQIVKLFSRIFVTDQTDMLEHLENGDIGETIQLFFDQSHKMKPARNSLLTVKDVDKFLERLSCLTKEDDQIEHFTLFVPKCTTNDLKTVIRLIKGDLRMGAGAKHILDGVHPDAYEAYKASRDLETVIVKCLDKGTSGNKTNNAVKADITLMTPIQPMLAEACKSVEQAMKKCPHGMYSEIKYDGERVQVHKKGSEFKYFSRHLKPVMPHKVKHFKDYIPKAFPEGNDLIIDSEVLMIDCNTGTPLPFGTLGIHKKAEFKNASVCLYVFDCIYYNGKSLINKPLSYRKKILQDNMTEIPNHVVFSEMQEIHKAGDLAKMIAKVLQTGLEGLVLKDMKSIYAPGKRHWLKVKKDYLFGGAMADSADLIVLGAWYGTGKKGGMMSVFLMGCYDPNRKKFYTVTKVHTGHDDKTLENLQTTLNMVKISQDASKVPNWLVCTKTMIPDFVAKDVKKQPVWEITGAEFTQHDVHTANGISIRFPRVTKIRDDKDWEHATNLQELEKLYQTSKENTDVSLLMKHLEDVDGIECDKSLTKKRKGDSDAESTTNTSPSEIMDKSRIKKKKVEDDSSSGFMEDKSSKKKKKVKQRSEDSVISSLFKIMDNESSPKDTKCDIKAAVNDTPKNISEKMDVEEDKIMANHVSSSVNYKPEYFRGIKVLVEDELRKDEHSELLNSFVEHGGIILSKYEWDDATHIIHYHTVIRDPVIRCSNKVRHLAAEWIKDSIANGGLLDYRVYTVQWDPDA